MTVKDSAIRCVLGFVCAMPLVLGAQERSGRELLQDEFDAVARELKISYGVVTKDGKLFQTGLSAVDADVVSPQFVKSRSLAYERALLDATANMMVDLYGRTRTRKISSFFGNQSSDAEDSPVAQAKSVNEKLELLTDAQLDKALAEEGVPAEKYAQASVVEKRTLLNDAVVVETTKEVLHDCFGCIPVKTIESRGEDGRYYIGVIIRYDRTSKTLAECFRRKTRPALVRDGGLSVEEAIPQDDEILNNFGVRLYFDETGTPALLSFGQFGSSYTGKSARMAERAEDQAFVQAQALADSGLTMFINSNINSEEVSTVSEEIASSLTFTDDGNVTPEEASRVIDIARKRIEQKGGDTMKGRATICRRTVRHPNGHKIAVVVRRWGFDVVDAVNAIDVTPKPVRPKPAAPQTTSEGAGVRSGATFDF